MTDSVSEIANDKKISTKIKNVVKANQEAVTEIKHCIQHPLIALTEVEGKVKAKVHEGVEALKEKGEEFIQKVKTCDKALGVPAALDKIPLLVPHIGTSVVQATTNVATGIKKNVKSITETLIEGITKITETVQLISDKKDALNNLNYKELLLTLKNTSMTLQKMARDPQFQQVLREMMSSYTDTLFDTLDAAQPSIDKFTDKGTDMVNKVATRASGSLANTAVNMIKSFLAEIPIAGGVISLIISGATVFNKVVDSCSPVVEYGAELLTPVNATADEIERLKCKYYELRKAVEPIYEKNKKEAAKAAAELKVQKGGSTKHIMTIQHIMALRKKSAQTTRRLKHMWQHFCTGHSVGNIRKKTHKRQ